MIPIIKKELKGLCNGSTNSKTIAPIFRKVDINFCSYSSTLSLNAIDGDVVGLLTTKTGRTTSARPVNRDSQ